MKLQKGRLMRLNKATITVALFFAFSNITAKAEDIKNLSEINKLKSEIVALAKTFEGEPDPDYKIQNTLEPLVEKLLALSPQSPVKDRLPLLYGTWKQVWGPYDYRNDDRGIDPELGIEEIYQVISPDGYYYNVSPLYKNGDKNKVRIGLLRGEYRLDSKDPNALNVEFTKYPGVEGRPASVDIWTLAEKAESCTLENKINIVPTWIVKIFFGGGALQEIYTDENLRILYGANDTEFKDRYLYIMTKVD